MIPAISGWRKRFSRWGAGEALDHDAPKNAVSRWLLVASIASALFFSARVSASEAGKIEIAGAIGPTTAEYIQRAIRVAEERKQVCLIIQLDTPGGLVDSTKQIVQAFYSSKVPVVIYVAPAGATATSAGCFITLAADVAAMAPGTSIGAAHPVSLSSSGSEENSDSVMKEKLANSGSALIESIAARRHRNVEWAKSSVRESAAITAEKALELKVIDLITPSVPELLNQLEGRSINGTVLHSADALVRETPMLLQERIFQSLWRPEVMFILMLIAMYGIIGELSNPGVILPGVVGAIALILMLYMSSILPVNMAGGALILLAAVLFIVDIYAPTHGVLTGGGIIAFFLGSLMLFNTGDPAEHLSLAWIVPATAFTTLFFLFIVGAGLRAQRSPVRVGKETMLGKTVTALMPINEQSGKVFVEGAYWNAVSASPIPKDGHAVIIGFQGLTLITKPQT